MSATWHAYDIYYSDLDRLLLEVIRPAAIDTWPGVERSYWLRQYAGGRHLKVCVKTRDAAAVAARIEALVKPLFAERPALDMPGYDPEAIRLMLALERIDPDTVDLTYKNNVWLVGRPPALQKRIESPVLVTLTEHFYADCRESVYAVLESEDRRSAALRIFFLHALLLGGTLVKGTLSFRSHWEGFRMRFPRAVSDRIQSNYDACAADIREVMLDVVHGWRTDRLHGDPALKAWGILQLRYQRLSRHLIRRGYKLVRLEEVAEKLERDREELEHSDVETPLRDVFTEDAEALTRLYNNPWFEYGRVNVNLLYLSIPLMGLTLLDRFALGYYVFRAVEDYMQCGLDNVLRHEMQRRVSRQI